MVILMGFILFVKLSLLHIRRKYIFMGKNGNNSEDSTHQYSVNYKSSLYLTHISYIIHQYRFE